MYLLTYLLCQAGSATGDRQRRCTGKEMLTPKVYVQESKIQFVFDAVYSFAHALDRMTTDVCGRVRGRKARRRCLRGLDGQELYKNYLLNVSFDGKLSTSVNSVIRSFWVVPEEAGPWVCFLLVFLMRCLSDA